MGVNPGVLILRCDEPLEDEIMKKIAHFCNVKEDCVIENRTLPNLYAAPLMLEASHFSEIVCRKLDLEPGTPDLSAWQEMVESIDTLKR